MLDSPLVRLAGSMAAAGAAFMPRARTTPPLRTLLSAWSCVTPRPCSRSIHGAIARDPAGAPPDAREPAPLDAAPGVLRSGSPGEVPYPRDVAPEGSACSPITPTPSRLLSFAARPLL